MLAGDFFSKKMVFRIGVLPKMCVMKIQLIALSLCVLASTNLVKGQEHSKGFTPSVLLLLKINTKYVCLSVTD